MYMRDISVIERKLRTYAEHAGKDARLGFPEQVVVMYLASHGASKQEAIAQYLGIDKGSIAKTIAKLEAKGLLVRTVNPESKREKLCSLSPSGQALIEKMQSSFAEIHAALFAGMSKEETEQACSYISRIAANISAAQIGD